MRDLRTFTLSGYDKGRGIVVQALWFCVLNTLFMAWFCPARVRVALLRAFGAEIGRGVLVRHRVRVLWPWKLTVGDHTWIGEGAWLLNLEPITIGSHVCVSQEALLCTGSHDHRTTDFRYRNAPVRIEDGAWVATRATVLAGVTVGRHAVVAAGAVLSRDLPELTLHTTAGNRPLREPSAQRPARAPSGSKGDPEREPVPESESGHAPGREPVRGEPPVQGESAAGTAGQESARPAVRPEPPVRPEAAGREAGYRSGEAVPEAGRRSAPEAAGKESAS